MSTKIGNLRARSRLKPHISESSATRMVFKATSRDVTIQKMNIEDRKGKRRRSPRNNGKVRERERETKSTGSNAAARSKKRKSKS